MWFPLAVPGVPDVDTVQAAAAAVLDWIDQTVAPDRTVVMLGFSQGGTTALQVARNRPARVAAVVLLSGFVAPGDLPADDDLHDLPVFWGRDLADPVIAPVAIERTTAFLPTRTSPTIRTYEGIGHGIGRAELTDLQAFLAELSTS
jgi:phospholipase/carboxylesterase